MNTKQAIFLFMLLAARCESNGQQLPSERLSQILARYKGFEMVKADVESEQFYRSTESDEFDPVVSSRIAVVFGPSSAFPAKFDYTYRKAKWEQGEAPFYSEKKVHFFGDNFFAEIIHEGGPEGKLTKVGEVRISEGAPNAQISNRFEVGDGFLLLRQRVFREIGLTELAGAGVEIWKDIDLKIGDSELDGQRVLEILFTRKKGGKKELDKIIVSPQQGFAMVRHEYESEADEGMQNLIKKAGGKVPQSYKFSTYIKEWQYLGGVPMPKLCVLEESRGEKIFGRIETRISNYNYLTEGEKAELFPTIPIGYRVYDKRIGISYEAGEAGPALFKEINESIRKEVK